MATPACQQQTRPVAARVLSTIQRLLPVLRVRVALEPNTQKKERLRMQAAIYARVSTLHQERDQTIESQIAVLTRWCEQQRYILKAEHIFRDEGYSGAYLDRPGLDRLRDAARAGEFDLVAILTPDRLARKYAYQVLVLEELRHAGCETVFVQRPISEDPNDQLLLQIQGAIAEYERAVLGERFRRGKWQQARNGHYTFGHAPYGYRYVPKQDGVRGHLLVDETEAELVRLLYRWLLDERLSIRQILKRLNAGPWFPRSGRHPWSPSVVHHILADSIYTGMAYVNRFRFVPAKRPRRPARPGASEYACRQPRPREEWIAIPVPALIDQATFDRAQEQLARNIALSWRHNTKYTYLLRCLLTCQHCGLAMFGVTYKATATLPERRYYICHGKDHVASAREQPCPRRRVKADELETAVWAHIRQLLEDPARLLGQFEQTAQAALDGDSQEQATLQRVQGHLDRIARQERRLIDAYQADLLSLEELGERRRALLLRREALLQEREQALRLRQDRAHAQAVLSDLTAYCERIRSRLYAATLQDQQALLQLLVERIIVGDDTVEVRHVIPLPPASADTPDSRTVDDDGNEIGGEHSGTDPPIRGLRSERVRLATLPAGPLELHTHRSD
jgi:site-specific DNA recombinase